VQIHFEQGSEYRCQDCRERCAVFILARDSELRLCESCFEKLGDLLSQPGAAITPAPTVTELGASREELSIPKPNREAALDLAR
jgi:hypothetical protein